MTINKNPVDDDIKAKAAQRNHHDWLSFVQTGGIAIQRSVYRECWQAYTNYMHKLRCLLIDDRINMQMIKNQRCSIETAANSSALRWPVIATSETPMPTVASWPIKTGQAICHRAAASVRIRFFIRNNYFFRIAR